MENSTDIIFPWDKDIIKYKKYIVKNKIAQMRVLGEIIKSNEIQRFCNDDIFTIRLRQLLIEYKKYRNYTYDYFTAVYYLLIENYDEMIILTHNMKKCHDKNINSHLYNLLGFYYKKIKNYNEMEKYFMKAINLGNFEAMYNLGHYYMKIKENSYLAKKYYLMAAELGHIYAMEDIIFNSEFLCGFSNMDEAIKLEIKSYMLYIKFKNNPYHMVELANLYKKHTNDYVSAIKYYLMAIDLGYKEGIADLKDYCKTIEKNEANWYGHVYLRHILTLIICIRRMQKKTQKIYNLKLFLPTELYNIVFEEYIMQT